MANRDLSKRDNLCLLDKLVTEIKYDEDRDIDVRRNKRFIIPTADNIQHLHFK